MGLSVGDFPAVVEAERSMLEAGSAVEGCCREEGSVAAGEAEVGEGSGAPAGISLGSPSFSSSFASDFYTRRKDHT